MKQRSEVAIGAERGIGACCGVAAFIVFVVFAFFACAIIGTMFI